MSTILEQKCPCCGGAVEFNVDAQRLKCPYCDTEFDIEAIKESEEFAANKFEQFDWNSDGGEWEAGETDSISVYSCNSCGGEIVADATTGATTCPYCGNQVVMKGQFSGDLKPDLVIPFKLDKKDAKEALKKHLEGKKFVPKSFFTENRIDEIKGIYVPHWIFSCNAKVDINYNAEKIRRWSDSKNNYKQISVFDVYRSGEIDFDGVPVDGSSKMPDILMESIEPFDIQEAVPFNTAYLAGYLADKYDVGVEESIVRANERIKQSAADAFKETITDYERITPKVVNVNVEDGICKYALYPVWLLNVKWNNKMYTFAMNGQTGKFVGDIPTETKKARLCGLLGGLAAGLLAYGIAWLIELL